VIEVVMNDTICPICNGLGVCFDIPCGECEATGQPRDIDEPLGYCVFCLGAGINAIEECGICFGKGMVDKELAKEWLFRSLNANQPRLIISAKADLEIRAFDRETKGLIQTITSQHSVNFSNNRTKSLISQRK
jgi:DnaJ-class molecular chaperone